AHHPDLHPFPTRRSSDLDGALLSMMLPGLLVLVVFAYLPMFGIIIAFKDYRAYQGVLGSRWVGLKNFYYLFQTDDARRIVFNTRSEEHTSELQSRENLVC